MFRDNPRFKNNIVKSDGKYHHHKHLFAGKPISIHTPLPELALASAYTQREHVQVVEELAALKDKISKYRVTDQQTEKERDLVMTERSSDILKAQNLGYEASKLTRKLADIESIVFRQYDIKKDVNASISEQILTRINLNITQFFVNVQSTLQDAEKIHDGFDRLYRASQKIVLEDQIDAFLKNFSILEKNLEQACLLNANYDVARKAIEVTLDGTKNLNIYPNEERKIKENEQLYHEAAAIQHSLTILLEQSKELRQETFFKSGKPQPNYNENFEKLYEHNIDKSHTRNQDSSILDEYLERMIEKKDIGAEIIEELDDSSPIGKKVRGVEFDDDLPKDLPEVKDVVLDKILDKALEDFELKGKGRKKKKPKIITNAEAKALAKKIRKITGKGLDGGDFFSDVAGYANNAWSALTSGPRVDYPPQVREYLKTIKDKRIRYIFGFKAPVQSGIQQLADIISAGTFSKNKASINADNIFHVFLKLIFDDGTAALVEKNQVINIQKWDESRVRGATGNANITNQGAIDIKVSDFFRNTEEGMGKEAYFDYSPTNNCQRYLLSLLKFNGLSQDWITKFFLQDAEALTKDFNIVTQGLFSGAIKAAQLFDVIIKGRGMFN